MDDTKDNQLKTSLSAGNISPVESPHSIKDLYNKRLNHFNVSSNTNNTNLINLSSGKKKPTAFHHSSLLTIKDSNLTKSLSVADFNAEKQNLPSLFKGYNINYKNSLSKEPIKKKLKIQNLILNIKPNDTFKDNSTDMCSLYIDKLIQKSKERSMSQGKSDVTKESNDRLYYYDQELPSLLKKIIHETMNDCDPKIKKMFKERPKEVSPTIRISYYNKILDSITKKINLYNHTNEFIKEREVMHLINDELYDYFYGKSNPIRHRRNSFSIKGEIDPVKFFKPKDYSNYKEIPKPKKPPYQKKQMNKTQNIKSFFTQSMSSPNNNINHTKKSRLSLMELLQNAEQKLSPHPISPLLTNEERARMHKLFNNKHNPIFSPVNNNPKKNMINYTTIKKKYPTLNVYQLMNKEESLFTKYNKDKDKKRGITDNKSSTADIDIEDKSGTIKPNEKTKTQFNKRLFDSKGFEIPQTSLRLGIKEESLDSSGRTNRSTKKDRTHYYPVESAMSFYTTLQKEKNNIKIVDDLSYHDQLKINDDIQRKNEENELEQKRLLQRQQHEQNFIARQVEEEEKARAKERLLKKAEEYEKYVAAKLEEEEKRKKKKTQLNLEKVSVQSNIINAINEYAIAEKVFRSKVSSNDHHKTIKKSFKSKSSYTLQSLPSNLRLKPKQSLSDENDDSDSNEGPGHKRRSLKPKPSYLLKLKKDIKTIIAMSNEQTEKDKLLFKHLREHIESLKQIENVSYLKYLENKFHEESEQIENKEQVIEDERRINQFIRDLDYSLSSTKAKKQCLNSHCIVADCKFKSSFIDE